MHEDERKVLEKQMFHWLVIKERKDKLRDDEIKRIISTFKLGAKEFAMDNYVMFLDKLMTQFTMNLEFSALEDRLSALELLLQEVLEPKEIKPKEKEKEIRSVF